MLNDILGQSGAIQFLRSACASDRLPHAMIFAGPSGVGKATTALALAGWFLCDKPEASDPCGKCGSCRAMSGGSHSDYHVITRELIRYHDKTGASKAVELSIKVIVPELVEAAARTTTMGRGKFFLVRQAELMNPHAQNAMLKTLEEPAGRTCIVLQTDAPEFLLPTIRSRCQIVRFARLDAGLIRMQLENRKIETKTAAEAALLADGSLGGALRLISEGILPAAAELNAQIDGLLQGRAPADMAGWLKKAADAHAEKELERDPLSSKEFATRAGLAMYLSLAARRFRARLHETSDADDLERACRAIDAITRCQMYLDGNVNVAVALGQLAAAWAGDFVYS
jgi:DNA polymerase-3 subunit delta'